MSFVICNATNRKVSFYDWFISIQFFNPEIPELHGRCQSRDYRRIRPLLTIILRVAIESTKDCSRSKRAVTFAEQMLISRKRCKTVTTRLLIGSDMWPKIQQCTKRPILYRFRNKARYWSQLTPIFHTFIDLTCIVARLPLLRFFFRNFNSKCLSYIDGA